jgi:UDP-N-acetylglucosamine transferase subunit ALG13
MIFVTVGTNEARFDRLLEMVAECSLHERLVIQHGHSSPIHPPHATLVDFMSFEDMVETIRTARLVVTHAGVGSVMVALANDRRPIVVPRRKSFGEAVDDHQLQLGRRFAQGGMVTLVETQEALADALGREQATMHSASSSSSLTADLRGFIQRAIGGPSGSVPA